MCIFGSRRAKAGEAERALQQEKPTVVYVVGYLCPDTLGVLVH